MADVQWNPHIARQEYIVSTSSEKLYVPVQAFTLELLLIVRYGQADMESVSVREDVY